MYQVIRFSDYATVYVVIQNVPGRKPRWPGEQNKQPL